MASGAQRAPFGVVMRLAVGQPVMIEKRSALERLPTVLKKKKSFRIFILVFRRCV